MARDLKLVRVIKDLTYFRVMLYGKYRTSWTARISSLSICLRALG